MKDEVSRIRRKNGRGNENYTINVLEMNEKAKKKGKLSGRKACYFMFYPFPSK